jgi:hypothetical protein
LFARPRPKEYSLWSLQRFKLRHLWESMRSEATSVQTYGVNDSPRFLAKTVAELVIRVNQGITSGNIRQLGDKVTETFLQGLLQPSPQFPSSGPAFARASGVVQPPELLMGRALYLSKTVRFAQATFLVRTTQTPVPPSEHPYRRHAKADEGFLPVPALEESAWKPASGPNGALYFYRTKPAPASVWRVPMEGRSKPARYSKAWGTLGRTGRWVSPTVVEQFVTIERPCVVLAPWRLVFGAD